MAAPAPSSDPGSRPDPVPEERRDPYAAFRIADYRFFIGGWFLALIGTRIQSVAIGWEMYVRTGDALSLGLVGLAQAVPTMLLALPAGYLADRFDRKRLIMLSLVLMTLTSLALAALSYFNGSVGLMYLFLVLDATAVILGRPARVALMPQLVPTRVFPNAVMWNTSMGQFSSVIGPAIGGLVVAINVPLAYVIAAATSFLHMFMLSWLQTQDAAKPTGAASLDALLAGMKFVWNKKIILTMISLDMFAVLLGGAVYLLPIFAQDILEVGPTGFGWLRAAPAVGAAIMGLILVYSPPIRRAGRTLLICVAAFGVATIIFGLSRSFWLSCAMLLLTGAFDNVSMVIRGTLIQLLTPNSMRGRVSAVNSVFIGASNELGGLESGVVAHWFGPVISVVSGGIGTLIVVAATAWSSPQLRRYGALTEQPPAEEPNQSGAPAKRPTLAPDATAADD